MKTYKLFESHESIKKFIEDNNCILKIIKYKSFNGIKTYFYILKDNKFYCLIDDKFVESFPVSIKDELIKSEPVDFDDFVQKLNDLGIDENIILNLEFIKKEKDYISKKSKYLINNRLKNRIYHVSSIEIEDLENTPMFFALEKLHSDKGWYKNFVEDRNIAYQYSCLSNGNIANIYDKEVIRAFKENKIDIDDYETELLGNPTPEQILNFRGTKLLMNLKYDGVIYFDYDPRNFQKHLNAILIFKPLESIKDWKLEKFFKL